MGRTRATSGSPRLPVTGPEMVNNLGYFGVLCGQGLCHANKRKMVDSLSYLEINVSFL